MANADSNTIARPEIESAITLLLKTPLGATHDLFQLLDGCQRYADALIENDNNTECMALCGRLLAGLEVMKGTLKAPLPDHLIKRLTVNNIDADDYRCPISTDSETLREYCVALTIVLLNHQESAEQKAHITGMLFEMVNLLVDDLKAPRFIDTGEGLAMISGQKVSAIH